MTQTNNQSFDIIVVGAGMVGAAFACACAVANKSLSIAVVEPHKPDYNWDKNSFDIRVSAITHASQHFLENLDVWEQIKQQGAYAYSQMQVWDITGQGSIHFDAAEVEEENLGFIIENRIIQKVLQQRMTDFKNIHFIYPFKTEKLEYRKDHVLLTDNAGKQLTSHLIVGADGANSWVRQQNNIELISWAYQQTALVTTVKTSAQHKNTCWQQFMPEGPLAFLPLKENYSSIVWSTTAQLANELLTLDENSFNQRLQHTFGDKLGQIQVCSERAIFPLQLRHAQQYVKPAMALIGDAAHTVHPLAGQGVNLGFADAQQLASELINAINNEKNPGDFSVLRKYERARKASNVTMLASMDILKRLFSNNHPLLSFLRNTGLNLAGSSSLSRKFFINYALGKHNSID